MSQKSVKLEILDKVSQLATAGFGLVAALAWNDAIQSLFRVVFPQQSAVWTKFAYALLVTALIVLITMRLGNLVDKLKHDSQDESQG